MNGKIQASGFARKNWKSGSSCVQQIVVQQEERPLMILLLLETHPGLLAPPAVCPAPVYAFTVSSAGFCQSVSHILCDNTFTSCLGLQSVQLESTQTILIPSFWLRRFRERICDMSITSVSSFSHSMSSISNESIRFNQKQQIITIPLKLFRPCDRFCGS